ncbi:MAG: type 2 isopentenyl-diphosphate Delta-isomerase [Myxococcota bacterium]
MADRRIDDKLAHIQAALDGGSEVPQGRGSALTFGELRFLPRALPQVDLESVDLSTTFLGKPISAPLMIAPMTGGLAEGGALNRRMAAAAERFRLPFGVGSQRVALEQADRASLFEVRSVAPTIPLMANLGAIQLKLGYGVDEARRAVDMIGADGLYLHLNAMQEVVQEGGDTSWSGVLEAIERLCNVWAREGRDVPIFAREVGFGLPADDARRLLEAGVDGLDCAGGGGTSWSLVEGRVARSDGHRRLGDVLAAWGLTTPEAILEVRRVHGTVPLVASGGIRTGLDVAKCIALGADVAGMASPILSAAHESEASVDELLRACLAELRAVLFGVGAGNLPDFRSEPRLMGRR